MFLELESNHPARRAYELGFAKSKGKMQSSIIMSLLTTISNYIDEEVQEFTSFSDFDLKDVGRKKVMLYVIIPIMETAFESLINIFFNQFFSELYKLGGQNGAHLPNEVNILLDEFVNLGKFEKYEEFLATCRGYGIGVSTIVQSITQLQALYGREKAESILGNNAVKICMNASNEETAKYFSNLLGKATVKVQTGSQSSGEGKNASRSHSDSYNFTSRELMTPDEVARMDKRECLLIFSNQKPLKVQKAVQFELFKGADKLIPLQQHHYHGKASQSQLEKFKLQEKEWQAREEELRAELRAKEVEEQAILAKQREEEAKEKNVRDKKLNDEFYKCLIKGYQKAINKNKQTVKNDDEESNDEYSEADWNF